jgi:hypothetical protein
MLAMGCQEAEPAKSEHPPVHPTRLAAQFDPSATGSIQGRVTWEGAIRDVPPFRSRPHPLAGLGLRERVVRENPNAPQIDPASQGVANAVVYLRGVDPQRSRPWDLPPVRVEMRDRRLVIVQGDRESGVGFVRRGTAVAMLSKDSFFHALRAGGASFFTLMFPDADQPLERVLNDNGLVEWSSGAGYYWMRAYTFVDEHPYYARTDTTGRYVLPQVPAGSYEVVCWLPNWNEARQELDPDMAITWRLIFRPPVEQIRSVRIRGRETGTIDFTISGAMCGTP